MYHIYRYIFSLLKIIGCKAKIIQKALKMLFNFED